MTRWLNGLFVAAVLAAGGCGSESKPAGKPTEDQIAADKEHQKKVEEEERGTPIKKK